MHKILQYLYKGTSDLTEFLSTIAFGSLLTNLASGQLRHPRSYVTFSLERSEKLMCFYRVFFRPTLIAIFSRTEEKNFKYFA